MSLYGSSCETRNFTAFTRMHIAEAPSTIPLPDAERSKLISLWIIPQAYLLRIVQCITWPESR